MAFAALLEKLITFLPRLLQFWIVVEEFERVARLRWGTNPKELKPGFHFVAPFFIDTFHRDNVKKDTICEVSHITTTDNKTVSLQVVVLYKIEDIVKWAIDTNDAKTNLNHILAGVTTNVATQLDWTELKKSTTLTKIRNKLTTEVTDMGIKPLDVYFKTIAISKVLIIHL